MVRSVRVVTQILLFISLGSTSWAQIGSYTFTQASGTYTEISGGTVLATATATTGGAALDDTILSNVTIPFSFNLDGASYTSCYLSSNGFITFGAAAAANTYGPINTSLVYNGAISFFGSNLVGNFVSAGSPFNGEIRCQTIGVAPNRVFVLQWKNFKPKSGSYLNNITTGPFIHGQIRLSEGTHVIQFSYGFVGNFSSSLTGQVGLRGTTPTTFINRNITSPTTWGASIAGLAANASGSLTNAIWPSGLVYSFIPPCATVKNVATTAITNSSCTANWTVTSAGSVNLEYGLNGFSSGNGTTISNVTSPAQIPSLLPSTLYSYYVKETCQSGGTSSAGPYSFYTSGPGESCSTAPVLAVASSQATMQLTTVFSGVSQDGPNAVCSDNIGGTGGNFPDDDKWFKFVAPGNGKKLVVTTTAGSVNDWVMEVWTNCPSSGGVSTFCSDDVNGGMPEIALCQNQYTPGATIFVRVWTYATGGIGDCNIGVYEATACILPPDNDDCTTALRLQIGNPQSCPSGSQTFSNANCTVTTGVAASSCDASTTKGDVFFVFNTGNYGDIRMTIAAGTAVGLKAQLLFSCNDFEVACYPSGAGTYILSGLNPQADYILRVWTPLTSTGTFSICMEDVCDEPTATISGLASICPSGTAQMKVDLTGFAPWTFVYTNGTTNTTVTTSTTPYYFSVSPTVNTTYSLVSVQGPYCTGVVSGMGTVSMLTAPTVTLAAFNPVCSNHTVVLTGGLPSGGTYSGTGVSGSQFDAGIAGVGMTNITYTYGVGSGCQRSASRTIQVLQAPAISSFTPNIGLAGATVVVNGSGFVSGALTAFNNTSALVSNVLSNNQLQTVVPVGATTGFVTVTNPNGCVALSPTMFNVSAPPTTINLFVKVFIQGFYLGGGLMQSVLDPGNKPNTCDSISISLASSQAPFDIVYTQHGTLTVNGSGFFVIPAQFAGNSYYLIVNHRNSIETWSAYPVYLNFGNVQFDFTTPSTN